MMEIVEDVFSSLAVDYLLNEDESKKAIDKFQNKDISELLRDMFASNNRKDYISKKLTNIIESLVKQRPKITLPTNQELIDNMGDVIEEIVSHDEIAIDSH